MDSEVFKLLAAGLCMGLGAIGPGVGEGFIGGKALEAIGRNPEVAGKVTPLMFVAMAVTESTGIYSLVIALIILFS
ncbi:MAG: ATP synthase F0 subunit C [Patescibacteria group bacterium]|jgi:F-type H+-transporting ATPase subunit c